MLRFSLLFAFLVSSALGADHDTYKNCSRTSFCAELRVVKLDEEHQFSAIIAEAQELDDSVVIPLRTASGDKLNLQITLLRRDRIRVKILEENHTRYQLSDVLESEPSGDPYSTVNLANETLTLFPEYEQYSVVVTSGPPFRVEFYLGETLEVVLNGDRLVVQNTEESQAFSFGVDFEGASALYGLFHHAFKLVLRQTGEDFDPFRLRNSDVDYYEVDSPMGLYSSIPVVYGHSVERTSGLFVHNAAEQWVDINYSEDRASTYFMVAGGTLDLFILLGPTPPAVVRQYTSLTGVAHLPQIWTLGYHQCRFTYETQEEVKQVVATFDDHDIQLDVIWLDDGHSNKNRYFEFNPENFTDPVEMFKNISSTGRKAVSISDPHIKIANDYAVYAGAKGKYFVKWANGSDYEGICWPGLSNYIDFLNPEAREYYAGWYAYDKFNGSTEVLAGIWNDMNEPSVFDNTLEKSFPYELVHHGDVLHRDVHNIYGHLHVKATHHGLIDRDNGTKRPFILTRSHFAGSQRYAAMWTGDNTASWEFLAITYSECMTSNILGMVFCGADIGGFWYNPDDELLQRWYQAAVWLPFFRGHSGKESPRREPYLFSDDVQAVIRNAIRNRYRHIPVLYTLFYEHTTTGAPVIRPFFYEYPELLEYDDHVLVGSHILARPVFEPNVTTVSVTFPGKGHHWYRVDDDSWKAYSGGDVADVAVDISTSPLFYRCGGIISRKDTVRPSTTQMVDDPYTLYVNLNTGRNAQGNLYVDDYTSFDYRDQESFLFVNFIYVPSTNGVRIERLAGDATAFNIAVRNIVVNEVVSDGTTVTKTYTTTRDGTPLEAINFSKLLTARSGDSTVYL